MSRRALAPLLALALAACGAEPSASPASPPASFAAVGPLRVGMPAAEAGEILSSLGLRVECREENGVTECRTLHAGMMTLGYEIAGGRVSSAARVIGSDRFPGPLGEMVARWEARYGPQDADAPAVQRVSAIRHWYREEEGVYRVHLCGNEGGMRACAETAMGVTPTAVAARLMGEAWDARDAAVICRTWKDVVDGRCVDADDVVVRAPGSGEVMRMAVLKGSRAAPPGGTLLFQSDGVVRHRAWRVPGGGLYGISCRHFNDGETCWEVAARYQPRQLLTAVVEG